MARALASPDVHYLDPAELGIRQHPAGQLGTPHRTEPGTSLGQRHGDAVHQADRVAQRGQRVADIVLQTAGELRVHHDEHPARGERGTHPA